ncbi:hypothetical protein AHMF7616_01471 [Adhaeribacter pallidiroseus]|uniref:Uncharacterized protein n=1 Tax=Adhaeribacter pallidiroseus TaxID=2072847 RepID=A0A369QEL6_9BACT|nr:hypothetical protein AHMF7616_01471 [Adhaeribacter pallidiroseus]
MLSEITKFLDVISLLLVVVYLFQNQLNCKRDYIFWFILTQTIINGTANFYDKILLQNNLFLYHLNCGASFLILSIYYFRISAFKSIRFFILVMFFVFTVFFTVNILTWENLQSFNSNSYSVASLFIVIYSFLYYLENLLRPATVAITKSKDFWFITGFFTYYASCFFIFVTFKKLTQSNTKDVGLLWQIHNVLYLILCIYLFKGIICKPLPEKYNL